MQPQLSDSCFKILPFIKVKAKHQLFLNVILHAKFTVTDLYLAPTLSRYP